jgi:hypothetical protein
MGTRQCRRAPDPGGKEVVDMSAAYRIAAALAAVALLAVAPVFARGYIEQPSLLDKIKPGVTTARQVEEILGPPASRSDFSRMGLVSMDYSMQIWDDWYDVGVMIDKAGIVHDVQKVKRYTDG